jgi:LmbE family N-acetylglucosaminyl deacetylase
VTRILVVAAHPDDAELAVGGTIAMLSDRGAEVLVAFLTVSESGAAARAARKAAAERAAKVLGHSVRWLGDGRFDQVEDIKSYAIVRMVDELVSGFRPTTVLTHTDVDSHADHVITSNAVLSSSRRWPEATLCEFPPNEHRTVRYQSFVPNLFVPIGDQLPRKLRALAEYGYEGQGFRPLDTGWVELQARAYGAFVGVEAAEAFRIVRQLAGPRPQWPMPIPVDEKRGGSR